MSSKFSGNWGDVEGDDEQVQTPVAQSSSSSSSSSSSTSSSSKVDKSGLRTDVEFGTNAEGKKIKITRKYKTVTKQVKMNKNILARQQWAKFGACAGLPKGPEENVTYKSFEIIHLDLRPKKREEEKEESSLDKLSTSSSIVVCRNCGETGHWTLKCPKRQEIAPFKSAGDEKRDTEVKVESGKDGKYVPMHMRALQAKENAVPREESYSLRVTNLDEDTTEEDLTQLFRRFGRTQRIFLARDKNTKESRGFAFVTYENKADAQAAIDKLNGHGYGHLILRVEWSKPRDE